MARYDTARVGRTRHLVVDNHRDHVVNGRFSYGLCNSFTHEIAIKSSNLNIRRCLVPLSCFRAVFLSLGKPKASNKRRLAVPVAMTRAS